MKNKVPARRFEQLYAARRQHEELRLALSRELLKWGDSTIDFIAIRPIVEAFETSHRS